MSTFLSVAGQQIDISHLASTNHVVEVELRGGHIKKMPIKVAYTNHCYSRSPRESIKEEIPNGYLIRDGRKERIFCHRRLKLSLSLPQILEALLQNNASIWSIPGGNYLQYDSVEEDANGASITTTYYVILRIKKIAEPNEPKHILVRVETAYPEDLVNYNQPVLKKPHSVREILANLWEGR